MHGTYIGPDPYLKGREAMLRPRRMLGVDTPGEWVLAQFYGTQPWREFPLEAFRLPERLKVAK